MTVACAVTPFVSPALVNRGGNLVIRNSTGAALLAFSPNKQTALLNGYRGPATLAARWTAISDAGFTVGEAKQLAKMGYLKAPTNHGALRRAMKTTPGYGKPPGMGSKAEVHHVLPWEFRQAGSSKNNPELVGFTELGFDVNDLQYGQWAENTT